MHCRLPRPEILVLPSSIIICSSVVVFCIRRVAHFLHQIHVIVLLVWTSWRLVSISLISSLVSRFSWSSSIYAPRSPFSVQFISCRIPSMIINIVSDAVVSSEFMDMILKNHPILALSYSAAISIIVRCNPSSVSIMHIPLPNFAAASSYTFDKKGRLRRRLRTELGGIAGGIIQTCGVIKNHIANIRYY